jgi:hypothetical protein
MRTWLHSLLLGSLLFMGDVALLYAQPPPDKAEAPPAKYERDNSAATIPYTLAIISLIIVMVLVCMPARRE